MMVDPATPVFIDGKPWRYVLVPEDQVVAVYGLVTRQPTPHEPPEEGDEIASLRAERDALLRSGVSSLSREYRRLSSKISKRKKKALARMV